MATIEEIDAEIAKRNKLAEIDQAIQARQNPQQEPDKLLGTVRSALKGASLGSFDEFGSLMVAAVEKAKGNESDYWDIYDQTLSNYATEQKAFENKNPVKSTTAEIGGSLVTGGVGASKVAGMQGGKRIAGLAGLGAGFGGIAGGMGADPGQRVEGAGQGMLFGAALGAALPLLTNLVGGIIKKIAAKQPIDKADRKILQAIERDQRTPSQVKDALKEWGEGGTLADVGGESMLNLTRAARGVPGESGDVAEDFLQNRMKGEFQRVMHSAKKLLSTKGEFFKTIDTLKAQRETAAKPLYEQAHRTAIDVTPDLSKLLNRPSVKTALRKAIQKGKNEGVDLDPDIIDMKRLDYTKRALDDMIANTKPGTDARRVLTNTKNKILDIIDDQVPIYKKAREVWSGSKQLEDSIEAGAKFMRGDSDLIARDLAKMTEAEREFFRIGALRGIKKAISGVRDTNSIAQKFENPAMRERLEAVFPDDESFNSFMREIMKESRYAEVRNKVLRGSQTAEKLDAQVDFGRIPGIASDAAQGNAGRASIGMLQQVGDYLTRPNPKVASNIIGKMTDPDTAKMVQYLNQLEQGTNQINPNYRKLVDAMTTTGAIQAGL